MSVCYSTNTVDVRTYQHFGEKARIYNIHIIQRTQNLLVTHWTVTHHHHHHHLESITPIKQEICEQAAYELLCTQLQPLNHSFYHHHLFCSVCKVTLRILADSHVRMDILYLKKKTTILPQNMNQGTNVQFSAGARQFSHFSNIEMNSPAPPPPKPPIQWVLHRSFQKFCV
jgi:hypothetical protein